MIESTLDNTYPTKQLLINGFREPYRLHREHIELHRVVDLVVVYSYVRADIPCKQLTKHVFPDEIDGLFLEINQRISKWLIFDSYHLLSQPDQYYFDSVGKALDIYAENCDDFLQTGDFNAEEWESCLSLFNFEYDAYCLVRGNMCFKNLKSVSKTRQQSVLMKTVLKTTFIKSKPKEIFYRHYRNFNELKLALSGDSDTYIDFENRFFKALNNSAPMKRKVLRANQKDYMT